MAEMEYTMPETSLRSPALSVDFPAPDGAEITNNIPFAMCLFGGRRIKQTANRPLDFSGGLFAVGKLLKLVASQDYLRAIFARETSPCLSRK